MGNVNIAYVPAAILLENPGATREQLLELFNGIRVGSLTELGRPWGHVGKEKSFFHLGIFELSYILGLNSKFMWLEHHERNLADSSDSDYWPAFFIKPEKSGNEWKDPSYLVHIYAADQFGGLHEKTMSLYEDPEVNKVYIYNGKKFILRKVLSSDRREIDGNPLWNVKIMAEDIHQLHKLDRYPSLKDLVANHPNFDPEKCVDWSCENGKLRTINGDQKGFWMRKGRGYYLDRPLDLPEHDYTSIIVTAEAIRKKAWSLFGFYGYLHTQRFLIEHPSAMARHQQAVFDHWTYHDSKGMCNSDFMRRRLGIRFLPGDISDHLAREIIFEEGFQHNGYLI